MIDSKLISLIDLKESTQLLDIYSNKILINFYEFFYIINQHESQFITSELFFKIFYFLQFFFISIIGVPLETLKEDSIVKFIYNLKQILFVHDLINNKFKYIFSLIFCYLYCIVIIILIIIIIKKKKKTDIQILRLFSYINLFFINFFLCFHINIMLQITNCENSKVYFLKIDCFKNIVHIIIIIINMIFLIFSIFYLFIITKFLGTISNLKGMNVYSRTHTNYNLYANIFSVLCYFFGYFFHVYGKGNNLIRILIRAMFMIGCFLISFYLLKKVYFYHLYMNILYFCGWTFSMWFYLALTIKGILHFSESLFFVLFGWIVIFSISFIYEKYQIENCITSINVFETNSIKNIEIFIHSIYYFLKSENEKNQILLKGIINSFEEFILIHPKLKDIYDKFSDNKYLIKKYSNNCSIVFKINGIIYTLLNHFLDKINDDSILIFCGFLINKLNNYNLAMYFCSKYKLLGYYNNFMKYSLIEDTKNILLTKLETGYLDNINKIQIGSVILYYKLVDDLKIKIYDAACEQIDYFDILRNNNTSNIVPQFINKGIIILNLRKEILKNWKTIISLNPFNEDIKKDFMLYLSSIIQDEDLFQKEEFKYNGIKNIKIIEKDTIYYSLFEKEITSIILIDSYINKGKIIYTTSNFSILYNYSLKEINNLNVNDLLPICIKNFHKELYDYSLKFSNLKTVFKKEKELLLKGKNNELYDIKAFFKLIPDLSNGAIYIGMLKKIKDKDFLIILDKDLFIDSMSTPFFNYDFNNTIKENYPFGLNKNIIGNKICLIIPSILKLIKFEFNNFIISKINIDFKGIIYPLLNNISSFNSKIDSYFEIIKEKTKQKLKYENKYSSPKNLSSNGLKRNKSIVEDKNYLDLIEYYNKNCNKIYEQITYKITKHSFINNKYLYYRVYISKDIFTEFENQEKKNSLTFQKQHSSLIFQTFNNEFKLRDNNNNNNNNNKIKIISDENLKSIKNKKEEENKINEEENIIKQEVKKNIIEEQQLLTSSLNSSSSKTSNDKIHFQELKLKIYNNEIPFSMIIMKIVSFIFCVLTLILIIFNNISIKNQFKTIQIYLNQNYIFNDTKICILIIYFSSINLKMLKYNIIGNKTCIGNNTCLLDYEILFNIAMNQLKNNTDKFFELDDDYQKYIKKKTILNIYTNDYNNITQYNSTLSDIIYFIFAFTRKITDNIEKFIFSDDKYFEIYIESIINYCSFYFSFDESNGLNFKEKRLNIKKRKFEVNKTYLFLNLFVFVFTFSILLILLFRFHKIECRLIIRIIKFHSDSFEKYIKFLEDLKKKLKNDTTEESKISNEDTSSNIESEKNKKSNIEDEKMKKNLKLFHKKKLAKISRLNIQRQGKINSMKNYFLMYNIIFSLNVCGTCLLIMFYYIIIFTFYEEKKKSFLKFDDFMSSIVEVFVSSIYSFGSFKNQTFYFTNFIIEKNNIISNLNNGKIKSIVFQNENYTLNNISLLENKNYEFYLPINENVKKIGNIITSYTLNLNMKQNSSEVILLKLFNGNACEVLYQLYYNNETKFNNCLNFWSSIITQGIEQSLVQFEIELINLFDKLYEYFNSNIILNDLKIFEDVFSHCDDFIFHYLYFSYKENQIILKEIEKKKTQVIYNSFQIILIIYIFGCIFLFFGLMIFIYYGQIKFGSFINLIIIFPLQYLLEEESLYIEIIKLHKSLYG